jgi:hypothetical protein
MAASWVTAPNVSGLLTASIIEALRISETSVYFDETARRNIPEAFLSSS